MDRATIDYTGEKKFECINESKESMSQVWKKNFCGNNKIKHYVYLFCLVVLLLPAQGS